ncbi:MAG TPA: 50S ribosomal protein L15 [Sphingobacteriaceae bacterium]|nr:50S ribosomal protein L15 [Sphingobacteriaceae bacterium]
MAGIHELRPDRGSRRRPMRVGRGHASGAGKTSGRGQKGQKSRSGAKIRPGFEGGQMPLYMRVPKRGFTNARFRQHFAEINLEQLNRFPPNTEVTPELLYEQGILKGRADGVKVLARGELEHPLTIRAHRFSRAAVEKIQAVGGRAEVI